MADTKIKAQWDSYVRAVMPPGVGRVQLQETRRAFYAGAQALMAIMVGGVSDEDEMTPADESLMEGIHAEFEQFAEDVKSGKA
jgi:hypothetical protein